MQLFVGVAMVELVSISTWHYKLFCTEWKVVKCTSERRKLHIKLLTGLLRRVSMSDGGRMLAVWAYWSKECAILTKQHTIYRQLFLL